MHVCMSTQKDKAIEKIPWLISIRLNINCYTVYSISLSCILKTKWNETEFLWEWMHYKQVRYICVLRYKVVPYFYLFCLSKEIRPKFYLSRSLFFFYFSDTSFFTKTNSCYWWQFIVQNRLSLFCTCIYMYNANGLSSNSFFVNHKSKKNLLIHILKYKS